MAKHKFYEHVQRSLVKTITFRMIIILSDIVVVFFVTRRYDLTLGVVIASNFSSTIIYFLHERVWNHIHWGRTHK